jgi:hypothetical protein
VKDTHVLVQTIKEILGIMETDEKKKRAEQRKQLGKAAIQGVNPLNLDLSSPGQFISNLAGSVLTKFIGTLGEFVMRGIMMLFSSKVVLGLLVGGLIVIFRKEIKKVAEAIWEWFKGVFDYLKKFFVVDLPEMLGLKSAQPDISKELHKFVDINTPSKTSSTSSEPAPEKRESVPFGYTPGGNSNTESYSTSEPAATIEPPKEVQPAPEEKPKNTVENVLTRLDTAIAEDENKLIVLFDKHQKARGKQKTKIKKEMDDIKKQLDEYYTYREQAIAEINKQKEGEKSVVSPSPTEPQGPVYPEESDDLKVQEAGEVTIKDAPVPRPRPVDLGKQKSEFLDKGRKKKAEHEAAYKNAVLQGNKQKPTNQSIVNQNVNNVRNTSISTPSPMDSSVWKNK